MNVYCIVVEHMRDDGMMRTARLVEASYTALGVLRGLKAAGLAHVVEPITLRVTTLARNRRAKDFEHMAQADVLEWFDRVMTQALKRSETKKKRPECVPAYGSVRERC